MSVNRAKDFESWFMVPISNMGVMDLLKVRPGRISKDSWNNSLTSFSRNPTWATNGCQNPWS